MPTPSPLNPHHNLIETRLPEWTHHANDGQWQALKQSQSADQYHQDWFANAAPDLREAVQASQSRLLRSQAALARSLKGLQQITEFAEPLLQAQLAQRGFTAPLRSCELLRVERAWHWLGLQFLNSHRRDNLLQAGLQNFADDETFSAQSAIALSTQIQVSEVQVLGTTLIGMQSPVAHFPLASETYQVTPLPLAPATFAALCRELDLGERYQRHLEHCFAAPQVRTQAIAVQHDRLRLAADLASLRQHLNGAAHDCIGQLLEGGAVACWQLALFDITLHEVMLIDTGTTGLLLYLPGHTPALRQCSDLDRVHDALLTLLLDPTARKTFLCYLEQDQQAHFLDLLQQNLDASGHGADDQAWLRAPLADLRPSRQLITEEPFGYYQDAHLARLKAEASQLAVPTASADAQARARRLQTWENLGMDALNVAGFFIPAVGTLMLAVTACQLLGEVFEGYEAWQQGDRHLALRHLQAVGSNLALIGGLVVAGRLVPKLFTSPLMERVQEVRSTDGQYRLWQPDLTAYRSQQVLPEDLLPNSRGQYLHDGKQYIRMDGQLYEQRFDAAKQQWRIVHPESESAWQPPLEHNGQGAWRCSHEQPNDWSFKVLARRLGEAYAHFTAAQFELAGRITGVDSARLRQVHLEGTPAPPLLLDTLERLAIEERVQALHSEAPQQLFDGFYNAVDAVDPALQRLLSAYPRLSPRLARRLLAALDEAQLRAWEDHDVLPAALRQQIEQVHGDLPLLRAVEGIFVPARANPDSERLLLSALDALEDWPVDLRLELRAGGPDGPLLGSVGSRQASRLSRLLKTAEGYEADLGERPAPTTRDHDLCRALEHALPTTDRDALGITQADGNTLRQRLHTWIDSQRSDLAQRLWGHRALRGAQPAALRGGTPLDPSPAMPRLHTSLAGNYRRLYPNATEDEIEDDLRRWRRALRSPTAELRDRQTRLDALRRHLNEWARPVAQRLHLRQQAIRPIINAWRRLSTVPLITGEHLHSLDLSALGLEDQDLATLALPDDFQHVEHLSLRDNPAISELPAEFHERFPNLRRVLLSGCRFSRLPRLARPERLAWLDLDGNRITWDDPAQDALEHFAFLAVLDLSSNPLLRAPDLRQLPWLNTVFLSECALTELPQGLEHIPAPIALDLSANQFRSLPEGFEIPRPVAQELRLESDWLSQHMLAEIDAYNAAHQVDLLVSDSDYLEFFEGTGPEQAALWQRLPLQYRRDLRPLIDEEPFLTYPQQSREEFWRRLALIDRDQTFAHAPQDLFRLII